MPLSSVLLQLFGCLTCSEPPSIDEIAPPRHKLHRPGTRSAPEAPGGPFGPPAGTRVGPPPTLFETQPHTSFKHGEEALPYSAGVVGSAPPKGPPPASDTTTASAHTAAEPPYSPPSPGSQVGAGTGAQYSAPGQPSFGTVGGPPTPGPTESAPKRPHDVGEDGPRPKISREPSRGPLDLPLEYVNLDPNAEEEESGIANDIIGRKSSYSLMGAGEPSLSPSPASDGSAPGTPGPAHSVPLVASQASIASPTAVAVLGGAPGLIGAAALGPEGPSGGAGAPDGPGEPDPEISGQAALATSVTHATTTTAPDESFVDDAELVAQPEAPLLGPQEGSLIGRKCLVLDLDETLVHSSFKYIPDADFLIPVEIDNRIHNVFVVKRPGVDDFLRAVGEIFEVVVFTASVAKYGDPLLDHLDVHHIIHHRLFRESCYNYNGNYIKNLGQLGRPLQDVIIIDNSPASYALQPQNAVPVSSWFSDIHDNELLDMLPFLTELASKKVTDVAHVLDVFTG